MRLLSSKSVCMFVLISKTAKQTFLRFLSINSEITEKGIDVYVVRILRKLLKISNKIKQSQSFIENGQIRFSESVSLKSTKKFATACINLLWVSHCCQNNELSNLIIFMVYSLGCNCLHIQNRYMLISINNYLQELKQTLTVFAAHAEISWQCQHFLRVT